MLKFELQALRITCAFGIGHVFLFEILDYWRAENYTYVLIFRSGSILLMAVIMFLSYQREATIKYYNLLCLLLCTVLPILFYLLDFYAGMPLFFVPNAIILFFYVFNAGLGHSLRLKIIHTCLLAASYILYSRFLSPHLQFHGSQIWNLLLNASISLLIGYLVGRFKLLNFVQQEQLLESDSKLDLALRSVEIGVWTWDIKTNKRSFDKLRSV
jgi:hypothetical protein